MSNQRTLSIEQEQEQGQKQSFSIGANENLLEVLRREEVYVRSSCGGYGSCSDCIIKILDGKDLLNSPTDEEKRLLGSVFHITKERLACQCLPEGDGEILIDISAHDQRADEGRALSRNRRR